jgi:hypothetical protein
MVYFKVISWHSSGITEKNHTRNSVLVTDHVINNQIGDPGYAIPEETLPVSNLTSMVKDNVSSTFRICLIESNNLLTMSDDIIIKY